MSTLILDLGSHSAKAYISRETVKQIGVTTWSLLENNLEENQVEFHLQKLLSTVNLPLNNKIAFGTEAMRRNPKYSEIMSSVCNRLEIQYKTITQQEESSLIYKALSNEKIDHVVNAGGGSIQIVSKQGVTTLLPFGISDLNQQFDLNSEPKLRKISDCIDFVFNQLPNEIGLLSYTGGERQYLKQVGCKLENEYCYKDDFEWMHDRLSKLTQKELERLSPHDPKWMSGAIASNCIVLALLEKSTHNYFQPSDINIAHGIASEYLKCLHV